MGLKSFSALCDSALQRSPITCIRIVQHRIVFSYTYVSGFPVPDHRLSTGCHKFRDIFGPYEISISLYMTILLMDSKNSVYSMPVYLYTLYMAPVPPSVSYLYTSSVPLHTWKYHYLSEHGIEWETVMIFTDIWHSYNDFTYVIRIMLHQRITVSL